MQIISKFSNSITKTLHITCRLVSLLRNEPVDTFQEHDEHPGNLAQKSNQFMQFKQELNIQFIPNIAMQLKRNYHLPQKSKSLIQSSLILGSSENRAPCFLREEFRSTQPIHQLIMHLGFGKSLSESGDNSPTLPLLKNTETRLGF